MSANSMDGADDAMLGDFPIIITLHFSCKNYRLPYTTTGEALSGMEQLTSLDTKLAS